MHRFATKCNIPENRRSPQTRKSLPCRNLRRQDLRQDDSSVASAPYDPVDAGVVLGITIGFVVLSRVVAVLVAVHVTVST